ncbi:MAG: tetratricopeptide repeat protein [Promethearchaeota archaeon]
MSLPKISQLTRAEEFFDEGELEKALEILNDQNQFEELTHEQKQYYQFLKGLVLTYQRKSKKLIEWGQELFNEGQNCNDILQSFDGLLLKLIGLCILDKKFEETSSLIEKAELFLKHMPNIVSKKIFLQRGARLTLLKAWINVNYGKIDFAEKSIEGVLSLQNKIGITFEIVWANLMMVQIMALVKGRFDLARTYLKKLLLCAKEIRFNHYWIAVYHGFSAILDRNIGELDNSLKYYMKSLKIVKGFKSDFWNASLLNNIGILYYEKGEYDLALEYLERSLLIREKKSKEIEGVLDSLTNVALEKGDTELAQKYFHQLQNIYNQSTDSEVELLYYYTKALILKRSSRIRDKVKAEELLKKIIKKETLHFDLKINALIHLCDLLLSEYRINNDIEVLNELKYYITQLLTIAENAHSFLVFCETFILQAKLSLLTFNMKAARRFLTQAQKIAEIYGIKRLAIKISHEHDKLLKQLNLWEKLKDSEASLPERWKISGLSEQMEKIVKKRMIEIPKLSEEEPVSLFIITEGGLALFSHSFLDEKSFESHLFGGFLTTIDYFIKEMFSEGLDRAIFGEYTLLMKSIPPFFITYIFKGDSYHAHQKMQNFIDSIQKEEFIWQNLLKFFQANQSINLKDIPLLESLITETFINKNTKFNRI